MKEMVISIDLGHGIGQDRGAVGVIEEETIINSVGRLVINKLQALGHTVVEVRPNACSSVSDSLWRRYTKSDESNSDWCISIHANCGGGHGVEIFTYGGKEISEAKQILGNIVSLGFTNRGIKDGSGLAMVRRPQAKSMLIEICFCDSQCDVDIYKNNIENISNAIVSGLTGLNSSLTKYTMGWNSDNCGWWYSYNGEDYYNDCWKEIDNYYYSFDTQGYARCNKWIKDQGKWYYLDEHCQMIQARLPEIIKWRWIGGKCYCFGTDGALYVDCVTYDGYTVNKNGEWMQDIPKK